MRLRSFGVCTHCGAQTSGIAVKRCMACRRVQESTRDCLKCGSVRPCGSKCLLCAKSYNANYRQENRSKIAESGSIYRAKNREKIALSSKAYRKRNASAVLTYNARWRESNRDRIRLTTAAYRATHKGKIVAQYALYYRKNKEKIAARNKIKYFNNRESLSIARRAYYRSNVERTARVAAAYRKANPQKINCFRLAHVARKKNAIGSFTPDEWNAICKKQRGKCANCGAQSKLTIDHRVPLSRGGNDYAVNIQGLCKPCNSSKGNRLDGIYEISLFDRMTL